MKDTDVLAKLMSKNADKRLKSNYRFIFKSSNLKDKDFSSQVNTIYNDTNSKRFGDLINYLADADIQIKEDYEIYGNIFDFVKNKKGIGSQDLHKELYDVLEKQGLSTRQIEEHFKSLNDISNELGLNNDAFKFNPNNVINKDYSKKTVKKQNSNNKDLIDVDLFSKNNIIKNFNSYHKNEDKIHKLYDKNKLNQMYDFISEFIPNNEEEAIAFNNILTYLRKSENVSFFHNGKISEKIMDTLDNKGYTTKEINEHANKLFSLKKEKDLYLDLTDNDINLSSIEAFLHGKYVMSTDSYSSATPGRIFGVNDAYEQAVIMNNNFDKSKKNKKKEKEKLEQKIKESNKQWLNSRRMELDNEIKQATSRIDSDTANMDSLFSDFEKSIESVMHKSSNQKKVVQQQSIEPEVIQSLESKTSLKIGSSSYRFSPEQEFNGTMNFPRYKLDENGKLVNKRNIKQTTSEIVEQSTEDVGNQYLKRALSGRNLNALMNLGFAFSDYNEARNAGDGVLKAGVKAGAQFVAGEMLGGWMFPVMLAKQLPTLAVSAVETTQNITRKMNSTARIQTFGEAQFQDTQQLATMRQAGMELAKMSQYNLQQSIMGNEAQYMHRL